MYLGEIAAIITAISWSISAVVFTKASEQIKTIQLNLDRLIIAFVFITLTLILTNNKFEVNLTQVIYLSISGLIGLSIGDTFLFRSFPLIGPRLSFMMMALSPVFSTIFSLLIFKDNISFINIFGICLTIIGIISVIIFRNLNRDSQVEVFKFSIKGIMYALIASLSQAFGLMFAKFANLEHSIDSFLATDIRILAAIIFLLPLSLIFKRYELPIKFYKNKNHLLKLSILGAILGPYIGITLSFYAIKNSSLGVASTLLATTPLMIIPFSIFYFKEKLNAVSIIGALIAVAGIGLIFVK